MKIAGGVSALSAGEINRADGLADLVVGVQSAEGGAVLVFDGRDGALEVPSEVLPSPSAPTALLLGRLMDGPWHDLAIAAGAELLIVQGRDRGARLAESGEAGTDQPVIERIAMTSVIEDVAWGDFAWEPLASRELAVALDDGTVRLLARGRSRAVERTGLRRGERRNSLPRVSPEQVWTTIGELEGFTAMRDTVAPRRRLVPLRVSGSTTEDLALVDSASPRLRLLAGMSREAGGAEALSDIGIETSLELSQPPVAALPMRLDADALTDMVLLFSDKAAPSVTRSGNRSTLIVKVGHDVTISGDNECTLREAINNANTDTDTTLGDCAAGSGTDLIEFRILGGGSPATIALGGPLPALSDAVTIDGTSQGCPSPPCIVLDGFSAGTGRGLELAAGSSAVRGLVVHRFPDHGLLVTSTGNFIEGNFIGTDLGGTLDRGNASAGVRLESGASTNTIGGAAAQARNVISGNGANGILIYNNSNGNVVQGNLIGTDVTGTSDLGNSTRGVFVNASANNSIGGMTPGTGNLVSGNDSYGVHVYSTSATANQIQGNLIGTDINGTAALPNSNDGVLIQQAPRNTVGGLTAGARNIISGNGRHGVYLFQSTALDNEVMGNYIGTDISGTADLGNTSFGVYVENAPGNTIGGTAAGSGNLISSNDIGVLIYLADATGNQVQGNLIGTDVTGAAVLGNDRDGVTIQDAPSNTVGGLIAGARNVISANNRHGVYIEASTASGNEILGNYIGTDVTGTAGLGNAMSGVRIVSAPNNSIGGTDAGARNIISGNGGGVAIYNSSASGNQVQGNYIGTDVNGTMDLGNTNTGVGIQNAPNNTVGGTAAGAGNLISGNNYGVVIDSVDATGNQVQGNYIGTDVNGTADLGNAMSGVRIENAPSNSIGGTDAAARNIISCNGRGVAILNASASGNQVLGNYIGTDVNGAVDLGNTNAGVYIESAPSNTIGGTTASAGNLISNNNHGVFIYLADATGNQVQGNLIGTDVTGATALGNDLDGVFIRQAPGNTVGGDVAGAGNVISGNGQHGVRLFEPGTIGNQIQGNYIGTDATGTVALGNVDAGVRLSTDVFNTTIGGTTTASRNVISGNGANGVLIYQGSNANEVLGNYIGTDFNGTAALGNGVSGVRIVSAPNNIVGGAIAGARNIISGNGSGVAIYDPSATGNAVLGNYIGTDVNGTADLGNTGAGVYIESAPSNIVGGTAAGEGNLISGNNFGVFITLPDATGNQLLGNFIGTDVNGTAALANDRDGIQIVEASGNTVGGTTVGAQNVISGNGRYGVVIGFELGANNRVEGNFIGTDVSGSVALGNTLAGVAVDRGLNNVIGGAAPGARNIISGNGNSGVIIYHPQASDNEIRGNYIGTDASGTSVVGNATSGVFINGSPNNIIGGTGVGEGNLIAGNGTSGVWILWPTSKGNAILGNSIHSNTDLGVALETNTVWVNDPNDPDVGCNDFQNFPVLSSINVGATDTTVEGWLNSVPNTTYYLEFFSNSSCGPSAHGEGESLLGSVNVTTDGAGFATFNQTYPNTVPVSNLITATATAPDNNTSEFSVCGVDVDPDGDTVSDTDDCDPGDSEVWTVPGVAANLTLSQTGTTTTISWALPTPVGGAVIAYDTIVSPDPDDFVSSAACVESDDGSDRQSTHGVDPAEGEVFYFLVRAENPCGDGPVGEFSDGTARSGRNCP